MPLIREAHGLRDIEPNENVHTYIGRAKWPAMVEGPSRATCKQQRCGYKRISQAESTGIGRTLISTVSVLCRVANETSSAPGTPKVRLFNTGPTY